MPARSFIAQLRCRPEARADLICLQAELKRLVAEHEPDCLVYELFQSEADPDLFQVVATFRNEAAFEAHMHIDFHDRLVPPILATLAEDMQLAFYRSLA
ncbi:MAG TPA: antibiotic biosynthesis monooxygenase [Novosphingobium sp.]|nr:antibiotic biosynthesis monooxygenase [Novosphingobium sp.]